MDERKSASSTLKSRNTVYRLLKYRLQSEQEVQQKLKLKKFSDSVIKETIDYFKELKLIDDRIFAQKWISERLNRPLGINRIRFELKSKGINKNIIDTECKQALTGYTEEPIVNTLAKKRARLYKDIDPVKRRQRIFGYLTRRGFSLESINKAIKSL